MGSQRANYYKRKDDIVIFRGLKYEPMIRLLQKSIFFANKEKAGYEFCVQNHHDRMKKDTPLV